MHGQSQSALTATFSSLSAQPVFTCPLQLLVVDRTVGPANVLADTVSRLLGPRVSVTLVDEHLDALRAVHACGFDLVLVGLEDDDPLQFTLLPHLRNENPNLPVFVVTEQLSRLHEQHARRYGAREVVTLPNSARDLKDFITGLVQNYLAAAQSDCM